MSPKVYLAGPMRGIPAYNFPAFFAAERAIREESPGTFVFNPARNDCEHYGLDPEDPRRAGDKLQSEHYNFSIRTALSQDLAWICQNANALILLPNWETSNGALAERACCLALDIPVYTLDEWFGTAGEMVTCATAPSEVRTVSATGGEKGVKPERYDLIPKPALDALGRIYHYGAQKYDDHNWRRGYEWSKSYAAAMRHLTSFWNGETNDPESGLPHVAHAMFHMAALLTWQAEDGEGGQFDDRYKAL